MSALSAHQPKPPERRWSVATPIGISVVEWGPPDAPPVALIHGGGDFARTFDGFAPRLAAAGWRVCAWDQRGHGDSDRAALYGYGSDLRDARCVLDRIGDGGPVSLVGHSKGGVLAIELAVAAPALARAVVSIDGFVRRRGWTGPTPIAAGKWCDVRRTGRPFRPGSPEELAGRRAAMNPRVDPDWIAYLVEVGAAQGEDGGWRWKLDPAAYPPPPHPWPIESSLAVLRRVACPFLGLKAGVEEPMATQPPPDVLRAHLPPQASFEVLDGVGHFAHVEAPDRVAAAVVAFLCDVLATGAAKAEG